MAATSDSGTLVPSTRPGPPARRRAGAPVPARPVRSAGNAVSREMSRPAGGSVAMNLAAHSYLDEIAAEMTALNGDLEVFNEGLGALKKLAESLDMILTNVDELSLLFGAPATTRSAADAASTVSTLIDDTVLEIQEMGHGVQVLNAQAFLALRAVLNVQDSQRAAGAGPQLLATAGNL